MFAMHKWKHVDARRKERYEDEKGKVTEKGTVNRNTRHLTSSTLKNMFQPFLATSDVVSTPPFA